MNEVLGPKNQKDGSSHELRWERKAARRVVRERTRGRVGGWQDQGVISSPAEGKGKSYTENFRTDLC